MSFTEEQNNQILSNIRSRDQIETNEAKRELKRIHLFDNGTCSTVACVTHNLKWEVRIMLNPFRDPVFKVHSVKATNDIPRKQPKK